MARQSFPAGPDRDRPPRAALFDWDGTLADSREALLSTWREVTQQVLGRVYPATEDEVLTVLSRRGADLFPALSGSAELGRRLEACFNDSYPHHAARGVRVFPGVTAALARLRCHGISVGVVTNKARSRYGADATELASLIDVAVCAEDVASAKPDPEGVHRALAALDARGGHAVLVGDSAVDVATANAAGIPAIGVTWGSSSASALAHAGADTTVDGVDSLVETVIHLLGSTAASTHERW